MLASLAELRSYRVHGTDGDLGRIDDIGFRQNDWIVRYVVIDMEEMAREALLLTGDLFGVYAVEGEGGEIGRLQDVVVDDETWSIPYLIVGAPSGDGRVLIATDYTQMIDLGIRNLYVSLASEAIAQLPVLSSSEPVTPELEQSLREYDDRYSR